MKQREWVSRKVELLRDIETKGGEKFRAGEILTVGSVHRGRLTLGDINGARLPSGGMRGVSKVPFADVKLLDQL